MTWFDGNRFCSGRWWWWCPFAQKNTNKRRAVYTNTYVFVLMLLLLWTLFGRLLSYLRRRFVTKEVAGFNATAFSMKHQFVVRLSSNTNTLWIKKIKVKKTRQNKKETLRTANRRVCLSRLLRSVWTFILFFLCLARAITLNRSCSFSNLNQFYLLLSLSHASFLFFRCVCTICSALLFAVVGFIFQLLSSLEFCWTFRSKTKQHIRKHTLPRMNFYFLFSSLLRT